MARGWESKSVEDALAAKQEAAEQRKALKEVRPLTEQEISAQRETELLEISRTRVLKDLAAARNPRYRQQLEAALKHLDEKLRRTT